MTAVFQGHAYSLISAAGDGRLALMHAGYKHARGIDGFPRDLDVAYGYYSNVGKQSNEDDLRRHENTVRGRGREGRAERMSQGLVT